MKEFFKRFDIHITCLIFSAGPYERIIKKISTLVAEKLAKNQFWRSAIFTRICRDVTQITMSRCVKCTAYSAPMLMYRKFNFGIYRGIFKILFARITKY